MKVMLNAFFLTKSMFPSHFLSLLSQDFSDWIRIINIPVIDFIVCSNLCLFCVLVRQKHSV